MRHCFQNTAYTSQIAEGDVPCSEALSAAALKENERFSEELSAVNERCVEVRELPELLRRYADAADAHARDIRSLTSKAGDGSSGDGGDSGDGEPAPPEVSEQLRARVLALMAVRAEKVAAAAERLPPFSAQGGC